MPESGDSGVYVYGIVPSAGSGLPDQVRGMDGHPIELVRDGPIGAVVTAIALPRPPGRRRDLLSHSEVLNALANALDVVPLRFGTVFPDNDAVVRELLQSRSESLIKLLDQVANTVQLNLRASYVEERVLAEVVAGSREIKELRQRTKRLPEGTPHPDVLRLGRMVSAVMSDFRREDSALLVECVMPLAIDSRVRERSTTDHVLDIALLVDRDSVGQVEAELERVATDVHDRIRLQLTGPLAPFDFVGDDTWA